MKSCVCEKKKKSAISCFVAIWNYIFHGKKAGGEVGEVFLPLSRCGELRVPY